MKEPDAVSVAPSIKMVIQVIVPSSAGECDTIGGVFSEIRRSV